MRGKKYEDHPVNKFSACRPTATAKWWDDDPEILAGRDLVRGGTWLGISRSGKFAFLTNFREVLYNILATISATFSGSPASRGQDNSMRHFLAIESLFVPAGSTE